MRYCARCVYPENTKPTIIFDEDGVCSGCRYHESRKQVEVDWTERESLFSEIVEEAKKHASDRGLSHDCIIPVSGGKDSHYQVWLATTKYDLNPLLCHYNHGLNTPAGLANLRNLVERSGCDLVQYTSGRNSVRRLSLSMLEIVGDLTWHYHAGIRTFPFQVAVDREIPLVIWGEHGFAELTGLITIEDFVEHTRWSRKEHDMRGLEPEELIGQAGITRQDVSPYIYPSDEEIGRVGVRGIYLSNFFPWDGRLQTEEMIEEWGFSPITWRRDRTFNLHSKIEDHANDLHDYLKFCKYGYGRATDDASMEIRHGRMTREEGIELVVAYDSVKPRSFEYYCNYLGISESDFFRIVDPQRDPAAWRLTADDVWVVLDSVDRQKVSRFIEDARIEQSSERTFSENNRHLYFNDANPPLSSSNSDFDDYPERARIL